MCTLWISCSHVCELNISWKVVENESFVCSGKPWNLVFASPEKTVFYCLYEPCYQ